MKVGYFPGCSLHATSREYDQSLRAVTERLEIELEEVADWACCGATSAHATNHLLGLVLPARTLALAEAQDLGRVLAPCAACFSRLATARWTLSEDPELRAQVCEILDLPFTNTVAVSSLLDVLHGMIPGITAAVTRPLQGLNVACYYGCLLLRPPEVVSFDDPEAPTSMEDVVRALGATPVEWHRRLECCGGGFSLSRRGSVIRLGREILEDALRAGAHAVAVACPMCHSNLDFRQRAMAQADGRPFDLPVLFLSQLLGLALGIEPDDLGMQRHFVSTRSVLARGATPAALEAPQEGG
jgi:heterodisulfide reductase subunit B